MIEVELTKDPRFGLGLALSGHVDRNRMGTFICGVNPAGPAAAGAGGNAALKAGDELLKVQCRVVQL